MHGDSDENLMQSYASGDMNAFEELYSRYRGPLYRYILRQVGDAATANDLYQGSWEKIIAARKRYRPTAPFKAWAYRIARNHLVDHFRRQRHDSPIDAAPHAAADPPPEAALDSQRQSEALQAAILELPPEQREALLLRLEAGLSLEEIASATEVGRETVKSRLRYATSRLKKVLQP